MRKKSTPAAKAAPAAKQADPRDAKARALIADMGKAIADLPKEVAKGLSGRIAAEQAAEKKARDLDDERESALHAACELQEIFAGIEDQCAPNMTDDAAPLQAALARAIAVRGSALAGIVVSALSDGVDNG